MPECTSIILIRGLESMSLLSILSLSSGVVPNSRRAVMMTDELIPCVYGMSMTSPPHSDMILMVFSLTGLRLLWTQSSPCITYLGLNLRRLSSPHQSSCGTTLDTPTMFLMMVSLCWKSKNGGLSRSAIALSVRSPTMTSPLLLASDITFRFPGCMTSPIRVT